MPSLGPRPASHVVPLMRYRDVGIASEWLCAVFGFTPHFAAKAPDGAVFYAELQAGGSMIMLGAVGEPSLDAVMRDPACGGQGPTQSCYVVVEDVRGHYAHARDAGAEIVLDLKGDDRGGAGYSCKDPEGHVWNFGSYDPRKAQGTGGRRVASGSHRRGMASAIALTLALSVISGWFAYAHVRGGEGLTLERIRQAILGARDGLATGTIASPHDGSGGARGEASRAHKAMAALKEELNRERRAKAQALDAAATAREAVSKAVEAKTVAEAKASEAVEAQTAAEAKASAAARKAAGPSGPATRAEIQSVRKAAESSERMLSDLRAEVDTMQTSLRQALEAQKAAEKARAAAEDATAKERESKDAALKALADAGARIATLEQEMAGLKSAAAARSIKRMKAVSAARAKPKPKPKRVKPEPVWPYSAW